MKLTANFPGKDIRFEGDRTLRLRGLPAGAQVRHAAITLTPVSAPGRSLFEELLTFSGDTAGLGATKVTDDDFVEVDLHARRTLAKAFGPNTLNRRLLVDPGAGIFMEVAESGAIGPGTPFRLEADHVLPGLSVTRFRLFGSNTNPNVTSVLVRSVPTNVSVRLGQAAPFWTRTGELASAATSPDFGETLQLLLGAAEVADGEYVLPLVIHSDTVARLDVDVEIEYVLETSGMPEDVDEVALVFTHDSMPQSEVNLLQVEVPAGAQVLPGDTAVTVEGAFAASRVVYGPTGPLNASTAVTISPDRAQAQPISLELNVAATAVDLPLACLSQAAVLDINLLADSDGKPFGDPLLPRPARLELSRDTAGTPTWFSVPLPQEFLFQRDPAQPQARVWLVVQARDGSVRWSANPALTDGLAMQQTTSGGLAWRAAPDKTGASRLAGLFRLRHTPDRYTMPLEVLVGSGPDAVRVSLERYRPLGRIKFTIDTPALADALNQAAAQATGGACPLGEQLRNPNFTHWTTVGSTPGAAQATGIPGRSGVAITADGQHAYVALSSRRLVVVHLPIHRPVAALDVAPLTPRHIALARSGQRGYIVDAEQLHVVDAQSHALVGTAVTLPFSIHAITLTTDGRRLYVAQGDAGGAVAGVWAVDTAVLEQLATDGGANPSLGDAFLPDDPAAFPNPISLGGLAPVSLACAPDEQSLYVTAVDSGGSGVLHVIDIASHQRIVDPPPGIGQQPGGLAITPDGGLLLISHQTQNSITLIDAARLVPLPSIALPAAPGTTLASTAVVTAPDGQRAFVANLSPQSISIVDLTARRVTQTISLGQSDNGEVGLAATPQGDRLYAAVPDDYNDTGELFYVPLGRQQPAEWALTTGFVTPIGYANPHQLTALLGPVTQAELARQPIRPSALSQVIAAAGGCAYEFSFWGIARAPDAVAEVIWYDAAGGLLRLDRLPFAQPEPLAQARGTATLRSAAGVMAALPELAFHRVRLQAPPATAQAEIRFLVPPQTNAIVDEVSFAAARSAVANGDLRQVAAGALAHWTLMPETAVGFNILQQDDQVRVSNSSGSEVALHQTIAVEAERPFTLTVAGQIESQLTAGPAPRVEVQWQSADGTAIDTPAVLKMAAQRDNHALRGRVPTGATAAALSLHLPGATTLALRQIALLPETVAAVPLSFVAQAPGNLVVSRLRVAYDRAAETRPAPPPAGLVPATPPGRRPGARPGEPVKCRWCKHACRACEEAVEHGSVPTVEETGPVRVREVRRRAASVGVAVRADRSALVLAEAPPPPQVRPFEAEMAAIMPATEADWVRLAGELALTAVPLDEVRHIGPARARMLAGLGIRTAPQLARADARLLADAIRGLSETGTREAIEDAQAILHDTGRQRTPLVSCIMPTADRPLFVPQAIRYFLAQDYPQAELIVVDAGETPVADLIPDDERIRYERTDSGLSLGALRNLACELAQGQIIAHWDDDVWQAPARLSYQVTALLHRQVALCGINNELHLDLTTGQAWHSTRPPGERPWLAGSSLCYLRTFWQVNPFPDLNLGEDIQFVRRAGARQLLALESVTFLVDMIHGDNTSPKTPESPHWFPYPVDRIRALLGDDWAFYADLMQLA